jgi:hypothetical protein
MKKLLLALFLVITTPVVGQKPVNVSPWVTEIVGGSLADLVARGPWIKDSWKNSFVARISFATGLSLTYEYIIEPWNGQTNAAKWQDAGQRFVGTLVFEAAWWLVDGVLFGGKK